MIRLSKLADYAFILLNQIVNSEIAAWSAAELAEKTGLPQPTAAKILKLLAKAGIVVAQRGSTGGYRLARSAIEMTVTQIIEAVDGPIALTDCVDENEPDCIVQSFCAMRGGWNKMNHAVREALQTVTLADLAGQNAPIQMPAETQAVAASA